MNDKDKYRDITEEEKKEVKEFCEYVYAYINKKQFNSNFCFCLLSNLFCDACFQGINTKIIFDTVVEFLNEELNNIRKDMK